MEFQTIIDRAIEIRKQYEAKEKLGHELADCLWSVIVLAHQYGVDLESSFISTMNELAEHLSGI